MQHTTITQPLLSPAMLDALLTRWRQLPCQDGLGWELSSAARLEQARAILKKTVEKHLPHMAASDQALYARLMAAHDRRLWQEHRFDCFDLMARLVGTVPAILRLRDLYLLLREPGHGPSKAAAHTSALVQA